MLLHRKKKMFEKLNICEPKNRLSGLWSDLNPFTITIFLFVSNRKLFPSYFLNNSPWKLCRKNHGNGNPLNGCAIWKKQYAPENRNSISVLNKCWVIQCLEWNLKRKRVHGKRLSCFLFFFCSCMLLLYSSRGSHCQNHFSCCRCYSSHSYRQMHNGFLRKWLHQLL